MSYDEGQVSDLIRAVKATCRLIRENLEKGNVASALRNMEQLKLQAEALNESHVSRVKQQFLVLEPCAGSLQESRAKPPAERTASDESERQGQENT